MKKLIFMLVVVVLMSSVAFAGQSQQLPASNGEFDQTTDSNVESSSYTLTIGLPSYVGPSYLYSDGNYSGILYFQKWDSGEYVYKGTVYSGHPQPWSLTDR